MSSVNFNLTNLTNTYNQFDKLDDKGKTKFLRNHWLTESGEFKVKTVWHRIQFFFIKKSFKTKNHISLSRLDANIKEAIKNESPISVYVDAAKNIAMLEAYRAEKYSGKKRKGQKKELSQNIVKNLNDGIITDLIILNGYKTSFRKKEWREQKQNPDSTVLKLVKQINCANESIGKTVEAGLKPQSSAVYHFVDTCSRKLAEK